MVKEIDFKVYNYKSRVDLRKIVITKFMEEEPGLGGGEKTSRYLYNVETLSDGRKIYLTRPAYLKKGFDFRINVEGMTFKTGHEYPKHEDIFDDLKVKRQNNPTSYKRLHDAIERIYKCEDPEDVLPNYADLKIESGYSLELILKVIKWFFIEQDIRDWNYSGRGMFKSGVDEILL